MSEIITLDDNPERLRQFRENLIGATQRQIMTAVDAIRALGVDEPPVVVFLDHDLGDVATCGDGMQVAKWAATQDVRFKNTLFIVHSLNPTAARRMISTLNDVGISAELRPFAWDDILWLNGCLAMIKRRRLDTSRLS